jgi:hypothetical protein
LTEIQVGTFQGNTQLRSVNLEHVVDIRGSAFQDNTALDTVIWGEQLRTIGNSAFHDTNLTAITFPNSLREIGSTAFHGSSSLRNLTLNPGLTTIGAGAFWGSAFESLVIPDSVTRIDGQTFGDNTSLTSVTVGNGLLNLQSGLFHGNTALRLACFKGEAPTLGNNVFDDAHTNFAIHFREGEFGWTAPTWNGFQTRLCDCIAAPTIVAHVSANPTLINSGGGSSTITVTGSNLVPSNVRIAAFLNNTGAALYTRTPTGSATSVSSVLTFPANTGTANRVYTIRVSINGGISYLTTPVATVTVSVPPVSNLLTFSVNNVKSTAGSIVEVPITIANNPGISAISNVRIDLGAGLSFHYPQGQAAYGANPASWPFIARSGSGFFDGMIPLSGRPQDGNISSSHIVFNFMDSAEPFDSTENGTLVTLRLRIAETAPDGTEIPITITVDGVRNSAQQVIPFNPPVHGSVTVQDFLYGDVTGTGSVDIFSVQALLIWLNSGSPAGGLANEAAGRVTSTTGRPDIFDAQALLLWINSGGYAVIGHPGPNMGFSLTLSAASMLFNSETNLVIEVESTNAKPGDIIDVPILITNNPGVSAIKELRIDLGSGLSLHYPQGQAAYAANPATWPFIARTGSGHWDGMIPISGRPQDGNIGSSHIVFNFMDSSNPFDSTETGMLVTLRLKVDESASGDLSITLNGGSFNSLQNQEERFSVLVNGVVSKPSDGLIYGLVIPINERPAGCNGEPTIADVVRLLEWLDPIRRPGVSINLKASITAYDPADPDRTEPNISDAVRLLEWLDPVRRPNVILGLHYSNSLSSVSYCRFKETT